MAEVTSKNEITNAEGIPAQNKVLDDNALDGVSGGTSPGLDSVTCPKCGNTSVSSFMLIDIGEAFVCRNTACKVFFDYSGKILDESEIRLVPISRT